jgi:hypothetical protein
LGFLGYLFAGIMAAISSVTVPMGLMSNQLNPLCVGQALEDIRSVKVFRDYRISVHGWSADVPKTGGIKGWPLYDRA